MGRLGRPQNNDTTRGFVPWPMTARPWPEVGTIAMIGGIVREQTGDRISTPCGRTIASHHSVTKAKNGPTLRRNGPILAAVRGMRAGNGPTLRRNEPTRGRAGPVRVRPGFPVARRGPGSAATPALRGPAAGRASSRGLAARSAVEGGPSAGLRTPCFFGPGRVRIPVDRRARHQGPLASAIAPLQWTGWRGPAAAGRRGGGSSGFAARGELTGPARRMVQEASSVEPRAVRSLRLEARRCPSPPPRVVSRLPRRSRPLCMSDLPTVLAR